MASSDPRKGADGEPSKPAEGARYPPLFYLALGLVALLQGFGLFATDPDFFFPDIWSGPVIAFCVVVALGTLIRRRHLRFGVLFLAFAAPLIALGFEVSSYRHENPGRGRMEFVSDRLLRYHYRPGWELRHEPERRLAVGDDWLNDVPRRVEKDPDTYRVVLLGDSVPNDPDVHFDDRIPQMLEKSLAQMLPAGKRVEVVNLSVEGYNTLQEVRLFERIGRKYRPDLVLVAYVLNDTWLQNPVRGRVSNSFFLYRLRAISDWARLERASNCTTSKQFDQPFTFDLVVRNSLERLKIYADLDGFSVLVATMPIIERFDDPVCLGMYERALSVARELGFAGTRVVDSFAGKDHRSFTKGNWGRSDGTHPNAAGHAIIADHLARVVAPLLIARAILPAAPPPTPHLESLPLDAPAR